MATQVENSPRQISPKPSHYQSYSRARAIQKTNTQKCLRRRLGPIL
jgi:hypothetical protein